LDSSEKKYNKQITIVSIIIPIVVALLFGIKLDVELPVFLPPIYASINATTAVILIVAIWAIKNKKVQLHERLMKTAIVFTIVFLILYIAYHMTSDSTEYRGEGMLKYVYFTILISHILLSVTVIPFVLITFVRGISGDFVKHKKIARIAFPLWLFVAVSGVIVYLMISPYY